MISRADCLAKAEELDHLAQQCVTEGGRDLFRKIAEGWRRSGNLAQLQETLAVPEQLPRPGQS